MKSIISNKKGIRIGLGIITVLFLVACNFVEIPAATITLIVLAVSCILFITELIPLGVTAVCIPIVLHISGAIDSKAAFSGLSNETVVLFAAMFIVGGAIFETGVAQTIGEVVVLCANGSKRKLLVYVMIATGVMSSVLSNTGCVAVLLPVCIGIADAAKWERKNLLMPLAMMASLGGVISMVGTPPNITIDSVLKTFGYDGFGFFEYAYVGIPLSLFGGIVLFLFYGREGGKTAVDPEAKATLKSVLPLDFNTKQRISLFVLVGIVIVMATGIINLAISAVIGALICFATKTITGKTAMEEIDWTTIFLFVGTLPLATALDQTGAGQIIADKAVQLMGADPSINVVLTVVFFIACALTQFMSNTASAALLAPIGIHIAATLQIDPHGVLMAIGMAASSAFATPMATPPNTLVYGPANVKFTDYIKTGIPLILVSYAVCMIVVPRVWPF